VLLWLRASHPDIRTAPVSIELLADARVLRTVIASDHTWKRVEIPAEALSGAHALTIRVDRTWNPRRAGVSGDRRDLGVGVILR
jgi:hypothetical protein